MVYEGWENRSKAFARRKEIGAYVAFSAFSTVKFLFSARWQVPSTLSR